ncbi:MarR family transcriptional regulator [Candidatus Nitrosopelagicus sp.]|nr:MarR family transcriptional regulator [Candidatus Nitrosopelagicus sp.]
MNQESACCGWLEDSKNDGMLLSPTEALILMARVHMVAFVLILLAMSLPLQHSFGSTRTLDFFLFPDGSTHVTYSLDSDPFLPDTEVSLYGDSLENLVAEDENGFPLTTQSERNILQVETLGSSNILINYDTYSLISKDGKIWSFEIDSPVEFNVVMPENSVIVGMSTFPIDMNVDSERTKILLPSGIAEITYFLAVAESSQVLPIEETPVKEGDDNSMMYVAGGAAVVIAAIAAIAVKMKNKPKQIVSSSQTTVLEKNEPFNIEKVLEMPDLREDDKEIIKFIHENGGSALESDLRKKFLLPRTTMWRAVKRLERYELIEITKKDQQNLIKLTNVEDDKNE